MYYLWLGEGFARPQAAGIAAQSVITPSARISLRPSYEPNLYYVRFGLVWLG
jgi:hypothetical protein